MMLFLSAATMSLLASTSTTAWRNKIGSVWQQNAAESGTCVSRLKPYCSQVSTPLLTILAPSCTFCHWIFGLSLF